MTGFLDARYHILDEMNQELFVGQPGRRDVAVESQRDTASSSMSGVLRNSSPGWSCRAVEPVRQVLEF
jgi:hypothetical protein